MKKLAFPVLALVLVSIVLFQSSCDKIKEVRFVVPYTITNVTVPAVTSATRDQWNTFTQEVITQQLEDSLGKYGASLDDIEKVQMNKLVVRITGGSVSSEANFDSIIWADAYLQAPGLDDVKIGYNTDIPQNGATQVEFNSDYADLTEHLTSSQFSFWARGFYTEVKPSLDIEIDLEVEVIANVAQ